MDLVYTSPFHHVNSNFFLFLCPSFPIWYSNYKKKKASKGYVGCRKKWAFTHFNCPGPHHLDQLHLDSSLLLGLDQGASICGIQIHGSDGFLLPAKHFRIFNHHFTQTKKTHKCQVLPNDPNLRVLIRDLLKRG